MECRLVSQKMRLERDQENPKTWNSEEKGTRETRRPGIANGRLMSYGFQICRLRFFVQWLKDVGARVENYFDSPRHPNPHNHNTMVERQLHCNCDFMVHRRKVL